MCTNLKITKHCLLGACAGVLLLAAGCVRVGARGEPGASLDVADLAAQVGALSNRVERLTDQFDKLDLPEMRANMEFAREVADEMRYEPVVQVSLLGIAGDGAMP